MPNNFTPLSLKEAVDKEFASSKTPAALEQVHLEKTSRPVQTRVPLVIVWQDRQNDPKFFQFKPPPGSLSIYWASSDSKIIKDLEFGYITHDIKLIEDVAAQAVAAFRNRSLVSIDKAAAALI